nr:HD domain-containing protein [Desulfobacterales bacterium]
MCNGITCGHQMKDEEKSKEELINELVVLRQRVAELEAAEVEHKRTEKAIHDAHEYMKSIVNTVREPLLVLDSELRVISANRSFYKTFNVSPEETEGKFIYDLGNRQWDIPELRKLLENILPKNTSFDNFEMEHDFVHIGRRVMLLNGRRMVGKPGKPGMILLAIEDVTEQKRAEEEIRHLNLVLRAIRNVNQLITRERCRSRLLQGACDNLIGTRGYSTAWIAIFDGSRRVITTAEAGLGNEFLSMSEQLRRGELHYCVRQALERSDVLVIQDPFPSCTHCPLVNTCRSKLVLSARLEHAGKVYGVISVCVPSQFMADKEELDLFKDVAGDLAFALHSIELEEEQSRIDEELRQSFEKLKRTLRDTVNALSSIVEMRDPYTAGHQRRVADLAKAIAEDITLTDEQIEAIHMAGLIHDIGKISVPADILSKPSRLNKPEMDLIKSHPQVGYDILKGIEFPWPIAEIVFQHHERMNGSGYPKGLRGEEILMEARVLGVADVVEAMASHRPYRPALAIDKALEEISKNKGILYDTEAVDACLNLFAKKGYRL